MALGPDLHGGEDESARPDIGRNAREIDLDAWVGGDQDASGLKFYLDRIDAFQAPEAVGDGLRSG